MMIAQTMNTIALSLLLAGYGVAQGESRMPKPEHRVESNVVYAMYSGLSLLMDVHHPDKPNGYGVIHISGSGWTAPLSQDARQLKHSNHVRLEGWPMVEAGYTVFSVNHRSAPRFHYPAPVEDVQRAVRFIRANAKTYGIDPDRIGAIGGSSGGHLASMLALADGHGDSNDPGEINRLSAKVQCAVVRAVRTEMTGTSTLLLLGYRVMDKLGESSKEHTTAAAASPISHVSADDPPMLLIHGSVDEVVPIEEAQKLKAKLEGVGVPVELITVVGAGHGPGLGGGDLSPSVVYSRAVKWMDKYLKK